MLYRSAPCSGRWRWPGSSAAPSSATRVALLTGSMSAQQKQEVRDKVASGAAGIVIGTHALLQDAVEFHRLAWWWSTSSTVSVLSSETGCAPRPLKESPLTCW